MRFPLLMMMIGLYLAVPAAAEDPVAVVLDFKVAVTVRDGGDSRTIETHPKVKVNQGFPAEITIESSDNGKIALQVVPHLTSTGLLDLDIKVTAHLGNQTRVHKLRLVTLQGVAALAEVVDEQSGESLKLEVIASKAPKEKA